MDWMTVGVKEREVSEVILMFLLEKLVELKAQLKEMGATERREVMLGKSQIRF